MRNYIVAALTLGLLPALWLLRRTGLQRRPWVLRIVGVAGALALIATASRSGLDLIYLKRVQMLLAAAAALAALLRHLRAGGADDDRRYTSWWTLIAAASGLVYINFFAFHGERTWAHYPDIAHYYLGSKYVAELGYDDLYVAMLRAEKEATGRLSSPEARDLLTNELVSSDELVLTSAPLRARFDDGRWAQFVSDVVMLKDALGPLYPGILRDHGYNPSPAWTLIGGTVAKLVPAGSRTGVRLLTALDPLLLLLTFVAIRRSFGKLPLLYALTSFFLVFGAGFAWTGGSFLRQLWLASVLGSVCALQVRRNALAGALLGLAAAVRIFPVIFLAGPVLAGSWRALEERRLPKRLLHTLAGFSVASIALVAATAALPRGLSHWLEFEQDFAVHTSTPAPNLVGFTQIISWKPGPEEVDIRELRALWQRRALIHRIQLVVLLPLLLAAAALLARRADAAGAVALAAPLLFVASTSASYYWAFMPVLALALRDRPRQLALLFATEAASYAVLLFDDRDGPAYILRSVLLLYLFVALWLDPLLAEVRAVAARRRGAPGSRRERERAAPSAAPEA